MSRHRKTKMFLKKKKRKRETTLDQQGTQDLYAAEWNYIRSYEGEMNFQGKCGESYHFFFF